MTTHEQTFQIKLGASRLIYRPDAGGAEISVSNPQDYPILVQGKVTGEDKKTAAPFMVTPPLFRLEAHQQNRLRIIGTGGAVGAANRETLQWLCVAGIPPKDTDVWAQQDNRRPAGGVSLNLQVSAHDCIKLITRPGGMTGSPLDRAGGLQWLRRGNRLHVTNPSPFYMNLASVAVGGREVTDADYVAPGGTRDFSLPAGAGGEVQWKIITDEGGISHAFTSPLKDTP